MNPPRMANVVHPISPVYGLDSPKHVRAMAAVEASEYRIDCRRVGQCTNHRVAPTNPIAAIPIDAARDSVSVGPVGLKSMMIGSAACDSVNANVALRQTI